MTISGQALHQALFNGVRILETLLHFKQIAADTMLLLIPKNPDIACILT
jgi:hypothetical protein